MNKITRFELIDNKTHERMILIPQKQKCTFTYDVQDNGRTLKVFVEGHKKRAKKPPTEYDDFVKRVDKFCEKQEKEIEYFKYFVENYGNIGVKHYWFGKAVWGEWVIVDDHKKYQCGVVAMFDTFEQGFNRLFELLNEL